MLSEEYMLRAIGLAKKGTGYTAPNPLVGAVIVKDNKIIAEGYHHRYGDLHAERDALNNCIESAAGADMYVTLEPCCHYGKQPPCTDAIIEAGIKRVIIGSRDPNPLVSGKGSNKLKENGIEVIEDYMIDECDKINYVFFHYITAETPYVVMKYAMTMDGKIAAYTGDSKWITGETARLNVHRDRHRYTAIMVGTGTVIKDNPMLNCRIEGGKDPVRIICDTRLRTPEDSTIVETSGDIRTIIATSIQNEDMYSAYTKKGCEILYVPINEDDSHLNLKLLMMKLGSMKIDSILLEGGGTLNWSALKAGIVNRVQAYIAPKLIGGADAPAPVRGDGFALMNDAVMLKGMTVTRLGDDFLIEGEIKGAK